MEENSMTRENEYLKKNKKRKNWHKIVSALAGVVVFCTTYALILPAITMSNDKALACPISIHEHTDACYDNKGVLTCGLADFVVHVHSEDCYDKDGNLVCTLPEIRAHKHTPECYEEVKTLICTLEEGEEHTHSDDCYQVESVLICDNTAILHKHTEECYDENGKLICGQLEVLQHVHDECCFIDVKDEEDTSDKETDKAKEQNENKSGLKTAEANLVTPEKSGNAVKKAAPKKAPAKAPSAASQFDLAQYITTVNIQRREAGTTYWENIIDNNVKVNDELRFDLSYEIPAGTLSAGNDTMVYHVPSNIVITKADSGNVVDGNGATVGTYNIGTDGNVTIVFSDDYVSKNANGSKINGHIAFESSVDAMGGEDGDDITIPFFDSVTLHVKPSNGDISVVKTSKNVATIDGTLDYEILVSSVEGTSGPVVVEDIMTNVNRTSAYTIVDQNGQPVSFIELENGNIKLPALNPNSSYKITYSAATNTAIPSRYNEYLEATNTVKATSVDSIGQTVEGTDTVTDKFTKYLILKSGTLENGQISWKIRVNHGQAGNQVDLSGWTLSDKLNGQPFTGTATIEPNPNTGSGSLQITLPYTFPEGTPIVEYGITYTTAGDSGTKNVGILTPPNGSGIQTGEVGPGSYSVSKKSGSQQPNGVFVIGEDEDGNPLVKLDWSLTVDTTRGAIPVHYTNTVLGRTNTQWPNQAFWCMYDSATNSYMTAAQAQEMAANAVAAIEGVGYTGGYYIFVQNGNGSWTQAGNNPILIAKGGSTADDFWSAYEKPLPADSTWKTFYIYFDSEFEAGHVMNINYSTTGAVEDTSLEKRFGNTFYVKSAPDAGQTFSLVYHPVIEKRDGRNAYAEGPTTYDEKSIPAYWGPTGQRSDILWWRVNLFLPANIDYTDDVIITEYVPEGLSLDLEDTKDHQYGIYLTFGNDTGGSFVGYVNMYNSNWARFANPGGTISYYQGGITVSPFGSPSTQGTAVYNANSYTGTVNGLSSTINKISDNEYQVVIPAATANAIKGNVGAVWVYARLTDNWDGISHPFKNRVTISTGDTQLGEASQTQIVKRSVLSKTSNGIQEDGTIPYALDINPDRANLVMNSDTLIVTDALSYTQPAGGTVNAMLDYDSVRVYAVDENENLTDITSQCPFTVAEGTDASGKLIHTIKMTVPDEVHVKIMYSYKMSGNGYLTDLTNTATVEGQGGAEDSDKNVMEVAVQQSNAGAVVVGVNVYKVDSENYAVHLNGAEFKLEKWNGNEWVQTNTYVTNEEKGFFNTGALDTNTAYRLTETKAPLGYEMKSATVYEFYILDTSSGAHALCMPDNFEGRALNNGDDITIANYSIDYEMPATGGIGTYVFYMLGSAAILAAAVLFAKKKRIEAEN